MTADELANSLIGCCSGSRPDIEGLREELDAQQAARFDELAFLCEGCGWYCSTDELNNLGPRELCDECNGDEDDES